MELIAMCSCNEEAGCVYRSEAEYRQERERQADASRIEHEVLAVLRGEPGRVSALARDFATLIMGGEPQGRNGMDVEEVLVAGRGIYFWRAGDGTQHCRSRDDRAALRLVA
ncbi:hypothetical protein BTH42_22455 [Burkholderia sp. SRS-W-2-2016]|uniref:hypothetical protein n=1 Tax=Burkholderia sp. SRS-W-2-2016 TaxID=1926878 RepID=UPI00094AD9C8|nr:hypothetical protein [Burkholderia sp. SRS-W-2-2016]OLL29495.1 hypothetical protein BTH42_22455 [Burkholderia sp. SRS-W-2-2016]